jgi:hypothetical protein
MFKKVALLAAALIVTPPALADTAANSNHNSSHKGASKEGASKRGDGKTPAIQGVIYATKSPRDSTAGTAAGIRPHAPTTPGAKPPGNGNPAILHTFNGTLPIPK